MSNTAAIWFPHLLFDGGIPAFYSGPFPDVIIGIVRDFAQEDLSLDDAVGFLWDDLENYLDAEIEFPDDMPSEKMAEGLVAIMLEYGLARPMPSA